MNRWRSIIALGLSNRRDATGNRIRSVEMNKSRSYFKLLEALKEPECPVCRLVLEDSRSYLDHLLYESVLDVPIRMMLIESFGFCSWHARQIPSLPPICAPSEGFAIFASDLLRKLNYVGRAIIEQGVSRWKWKSWFRKNCGRLLALIKQRGCPACEHAKQFERYHLNELLDAIGEEEFLSEYKRSQGICLPHLLILEEFCSSHANLSLLLEVQLVKTNALRDTLEEFIRKQDFRFRDQITPEEAKSPKTAMEFLVGMPGIFANEMGHDLSQRSRAKKRQSIEPSPAWASFLSNGQLELMADLKSAGHVALYLRKPLPEVLFQSIKQLGDDCGRGTIEAVVEDLLDVGYLRILHEANFSVFYGIGLPQQTTILVDRKKGFLLEDDENNSTWRLRPLKNAEDFSLTMLWHKFGNAVSLHGVVNYRDCAKGLICVATHGKREQWCRFKDPVVNKIPAVGTNIEIFGWEKWNTRILEVLELKELDANVAIHN